MCKYVCVLHTGILFYLSPTGRCGLERWLPLKEGDNQRRLRGATEGGRLILLLLLAAVLRASGQWEQHWSEVSPVHISFCHALNVLHPQATTGDSSDSQWAAGLIRTALDAMPACTAFPLVYSGRWLCLKGLAALASILQQLHLATVSLQPLSSDISF